MTWQQKRQEALDWLMQTFPNTFSKKPVPLQIGIDDAILARKLELMPTKFILRKALQYYVNSTAYLRQMVVDAPRVDLTGEIVGSVSEKQALYALKQLKRIHNEIKRTLAKELNGLSTDAKEVGVDSQPLEPVNNPALARPLLTLTLKKTSNKNQLPPSNAQRTSIPSGPLNDTDKNKEIAIKLKKRVNTALKEG